jgi:hypothetical protein
MNSAIQQTDYVIDNICDKFVSLVAIRKNIWAEMIWAAFIILSYIEYHFKGLSKDAFC